MGKLLMVMEQNTKPVKKAKKTPEEIMKDLEETGLDLSPVGLGPWSYSKLKVLKNCPLKFYLQYVLKMKPKEEPPISLVTEVGKAGHKILELMIAGKCIEDAYKATQKEYEATITKEEWEDHLDTVEYSIQKFMDRLEDFEKSHGVKRFLQEIRIGCTKDWEPTGFFADDVFFRGVVDLVIQLNNNDIIIIDHKFGPPAAMGIRNFQDQLNVYPVLFHKGIQPIRGAQVGINFIKDGETTLGNYVSAEDIEDSLQPRLDFFIEGTIDGVKELGFFKHIAGNTCKYCDFKAECKAGEFKQLEKESKKWFELKKV